MPCLDTLLMASGLCMCCGGNRVGQTQQETEKGEGQDMPLLSLLAVVLQEPECALEGQSLYRAQSEFFKPSF